MSPTEKRYELKPLLAKIITDSSELGYAEVP